MKRDFIERGYRRTDTGCDRVCYDTRQSAKAALKRFRRDPNYRPKGDVALRVYVCGCGAIHIGHVRGTAGTLREGV